MNDSRQRPSIPKRPKFETENPGLSLNLECSIWRSSNISEISTKKIPAHETSPLPKSPSRDTPPHIPVVTTQYSSVKKVQIYHTAWGMNALNHVQAVHFAVTSYLHEYQSLPDGVCVSKQCMAGYISEILTYHQGDPYRFALPLGNQTVYIPIYADSRYGLLVPNRIQCFQYIDVPQWERHE